MIKPSYQTPLADVEWCRWRNLNFEFPREETWEVAIELPTSGILFTLCKVVYMSVIDQDLPDSIPTLLYCSWMAAVGEKVQSPTVPASVPVRVAHELLQAGHRYLDVRYFINFC